MNDFRIGEQRLIGGDRIYAMQKKYRNHRLAFPRTRSTSSMSRKVFIRLLAKEFRCLKKLKTVWIELILLFDFILTSRMDRCLEETEYFQTPRLSPHTRRCV